MPFAFPLPWRALSHPPPRCILQLFISQRSNARDNWLAWPHCPPFYESASFVHQLQAQSDTLQAQPSKNERGKHSEQAMRPPRDDNEANGRP